MKVPEWLPMKNEGKGFKWDLNLVNGVFQFVKQEVSNGLSGQAH